jgi:hypothetical protein
MAKQWRKESIEEMEHADKLVVRIIFLDGFPNLQLLDPLHIGQNVKRSSTAIWRRRFSPVGSTRKPPRIATPRKIM